jgi:site-specific DNA recombinase
MVDGYQSKENSKHTSRAMRENARQGFYNGSKPPFGYISVTTNIPGSRGRHRKKLAVNDAESGIAKLIFEFYLHGVEGRQMGCKEIANYLTHKGLLFRGKPWRKQQVHKVVSNSLYMGEYFTNNYDTKTKKAKPATEWILTRVPPIIDAALYEQVRVKRESRTPTNANPSIAASPTLLTGLLKCACGASMTIATGKSGRYKYYKCTSRESRGNYACASVSLPMGRVDSLVLEQIRQKVLAPDHLAQIIAQLEVTLKSSRDQIQGRINEINQQIKQTELRQSRLLEAIETGTIELDGITAKRAQTLKAQREALFIELARVRRESALPTERVFRKEYVNALGEVLREKLHDPASPFAKSYLNILVDKIVVSGNEATIKGSHLALVNAMQRAESVSSEEVPISVPDWCARRDSNPQPSDPKSEALSIELRTLVHRVIVPTQFVSLAPYFQSRDCLTDKR